MIGLRSMQHLTQGAMSATGSAGRVMAEGAFEKMGMEISEKIGLKAAVSDMIARPINHAKDIFFPKPTSTMQKALGFIQKPSVIGTGVLGLAGLYAIGRMTETPEKFDAKNIMNLDQKGA